MLHLVNAFYFTFYNIQHSKLEFTNSALPPELVPQVPPGHSLAPLVLASIIARPVVGGEKSGDLSPQVISLFSVLRVIHAKHDHLLIHQVVLNKLIFVVSAGKILITILMCHLRKRKRLAWKKVQTQLMKRYKVNKNLYYFMVKLKVKVIEKESR